MDGRREQVANETGLLFGRWVQRVLVTRHLWVFWTLGGAGGRLQRRMLLFGNLCLNVLLVLLLGDMALLEAT